eukprot:PLAT15564.1.p1 GENE.PLAT15564.1~~PLAT15564.1.p1  ORF type:complete len:362 (+),score=77.92 PLAT15564.1:107-1192(+)
MMRKSAPLLLLVACLLAFVAADCPNSCSGHGTCGSSDVCTCYRNWMAADCSQRICPFGHAFSDRPKGDLNHDGATDTDTYVSEFMNGLDTDFQDSTEENSFHFYRECSAAGTCNRETGLCECLPLYTGSACQRTVCPNSCSGHGKCISAGEKGSTDYADWWDADKTFGCECDGGFTGADCSKRSCRNGHDAMVNNVLSVVTLDIAFAGGTCTDIFVTFTDRLGDAYVGRIDSLANWEVKDGGNNAAAVTSMENLLEGLPNGAVLAATVTVAATTDGASHGTLFTITFTDPAQDPPSVGSVLSASCASDPTINAALVDTGETPGSDSYECGRQGLCDYETGVCKCFSGYTGLTCSVQNVLAM